MEEYKKKALLRRERQQLDLPDSEDEEEQVRSCAWAEGRCRAAASSMR